MNVVTDVHPAVDAPARYQTLWRQPFDDQVRARLRPGITVLDVGSGRTPTISPADRPARTTYVGLDLSRDELLRAGPGAYDHVVVGDLAIRAQELVNTVDLAVSWQVFE